MRQPVQPSSHFYHPLDAVLGTPAAVRILRVLSLHQGALTTTSVARRSGLGRAGAHRALERLVRARIIAPVGDPARPLFELSRDRQLAGELARLFRAEAARTDDFFSDLRDAAAATDPPPVAVWLIGSAARGEDSVGSDIDIAVVFRQGRAPGLKLFSQKVYESGARAGVRASLLGLSLRELSRHARRNDDWWRNLVRDAVPIVGREPAGLIDD